MIAFTLLTCVMTYPQVLHLRDTVHDDGDPLLNTWALAWVAHQLPRAPAHLFDANIFYPERRTLAYSETLLLPAVVAAPLHWIGIGPILVYNLVFLSGFVISGVGMALLVRSLTASSAAGLIAGVVFAFLPYRIDHFAHMQLQQTQCLPFAMWAFHRLTTSGSIRDGALFGALTAGQVLSCMYYGLLMIPFMAVVCATLVIAGWQKRRTAGFVPLLIAGAIVVVAAYPVARAYLGARKVVGERTAEEIVTNGSAVVTDYLGPPEENLVYGKVFARFARGERKLFPGFVAIGLALFGIVGTRGTLGTRGTSASRGTLVLAYGLGLLIAFDVSLGFNGITYRVLYAYVLPFRGLRIPARSGMLVGFALAVLAGLGVARIRRREVVAVLGMLMCVEYLSHHIPQVTVPLAPPQAYADLMRDNAGNPPATLFEFPASSQDDPTYMYYSTFHWQHLANGYSGFFPPSYIFMVNQVQNLPEDMGVTAIKNHGARYLLIHGERLFGGRYAELTEQLKRRRDMTLVSHAPAEREGQHGEISVFRISYNEDR